VQTTDSNGHPRPQLTRPRWTDLNGTWRFAHDDANVGLDQRWFEQPERLDREIQVPFPPESPASGIGETGYHPVVWYSRTFAAPQDDGERLLLHFGAVDYRASVWVNGRWSPRTRAVTRPSAPTSPGELRPDGDQVVTVRAEDSPTDLTQPRGKQDWREKPHSIWYERTTGIWQPVWLEPVPHNRIQSLRWTPDLHRALLGLCVVVPSTTRLCAWGCG
jgi:beta-galactosidase/beta-glucuronidase